jgi:hypothetical protein
MSQKWPSYGFSDYMLRLYKLLRPWFEWSFRHIQDTKPCAKWIFDNGTLAYGNIEWIYKCPASLCFEGLHSRNHIFHQVVYFDP